jgi:hypothetical protein
MEAPPESPAGRAAAWIRQEVAEGRAVPPERGAQLIVFLASGRADVLSGRYLTVHDDVPALVGQAENILRDDLYTLRLREPRAGPEQDTARSREPTGLNKLLRRLGVR